MNKKIFLTNDDGIESPALWETARALQSLGDVTIVAPKVQQSGTGRSMPKHLRLRSSKCQIGRDLKERLIQSTPPLRKLCNMGCWRLWVKNLICWCLV